MINFNSFLYRLPLVLYFIYTFFRFLYFVQEVGHFFFFNVARSVLLFFLNQVGSNKATELWRKRKRKSPFLCTNSSSSSSSSRSSLFFLYSFSLYSLHIAIKISPLFPNFLFFFIYYIIISPMYILIDFM